MIKKTKSGEIRLINNNLEVSRFSFEKLTTKYILNFIELSDFSVPIRNAKEQLNTLEIKLIHSDVFWNECESISNHNFGIFSENTDY